MATTRLTALRLARHAEWFKLVRSALERTRSVPGAAALLTRRGYPCSRGLLYRYLRSDRALEAGLDLPAHKGLPRGARRPDKLDGWTPSPATLTRRARRAAAKTRST